MADLPASNVLKDLFRLRRSGLVEYACAITRDRAAAEDVVQDAWVRLHGSDAFAAADRPEAFLYRTVRNLALDRMRRARFERLHFTDQDAADLRAQADEPTPEAAAASREALRKTLTAMQALPQRMQIAVQMHRIEGARLKDIAERLGVSVTVAHELVAEGVERCRDALRRRG